MKYVNETFPEGNFFRTHKLWDRRRRFGRWDRLKCFFGFHPIEFWVAGLAEHCASCNWHHGTTFRVRMRYLLRRT
jgi:hypothetical protein